MDAKADMLLKMRFLAIKQNRHRTTMMPPFTFLLWLFQVCISGFVFCPSEHIPIWYVDGKGLRAELKVCLYSL